MHPNPPSNKEHALVDPSACTSACTSKVKNDQDTTLETLAAALLTLSPADRAKLAAMLLGQQLGQGAGRGATP
jgi:hypothetical protein